MHIDMYMFIDLDKVSHFLPTHIDLLKSQASGRNHDFS